MNDLAIANERRSAQVGDAFRLPVLLRPLQADGNWGWKNGKAGNS